VRRRYDIADEPRWGSMPRRSWDTVTWLADNQRARRELGWAPTTDLETGLDLMAEWLRADRVTLEMYRRSGGNLR
jgi:nucleoside-diphosphate-sugar epimerase